MRILFAGTPDIGVPSLELLSTEFEICGVLTNPDSRQGRKKTLVPSPVKEKAVELNINVYQPNKLDEEFCEIIKEIKPDLLVCIAFGKIFRKSFLDLFPLGGINLHPSLLPIYRGPSPLSEAIKNGDSTTGISVQRLALKMDSGNILHQEELILDGRETTESLTKNVAEVGAPLVLKVVKNIDSNNLDEYEQDHSKATFCSLTKKEDGVINWNSETDNILNSIRAYTPWPLAHTIFNEKGLNILEAHVPEDLLEKPVGEPGTVLLYSKRDGFLIKTLDGAIFVTKLQLQSKKALDYKSFNNGVQNFVGARLG